MKIFLKTEDEIELMRQANQLVGKTLGELAKHIKPGVTTLQLDQIADAFIRDHGAVPTFKGFPNPYGGPFPASICTSVNDVVVHGVPNKETVLKEGDIISIDCGTLLNGFNGDSCYTFCVGEVSDEVKELLKVTKESLYLGIEAAQAGRHLGDISSAIQDHCEAHNYGRRGNGVMLKAAMCIAIEPMITMGKRDIWLDQDRWSIRTRDGKPAAHFEHTIAIRKGKAEILSSFEEVEQVEGILY